MRRPRSRPAAAAARTCRPNLPPGRATLRVNHDYHRRGALTYPVAWNVHLGRVFARCADTTGIAPFTALVEPAAQTEPAPRGHLAELLGAGQYAMADVADLFGTGRATVYRVLRRTATSSADGRAVPRVLAAAQPGRHRAH